MARKKSGHYCYGCDRYRANEKFSGQGHRKHLCKDCKSMGKMKQEKMQINNKPSINQYIKLLKVRLMVFTDTEGFIFFEIRNKSYGIKSNFEELSSAELAPCIFRINIDSTFSLATELLGDINDVNEALMIKCENQFELGVYLDDYTYEVIDGSELTVLQNKYLLLFPAILAFDRTYFIEDS